MVSGEVGDANTLMPPSVLARPGEVVTQRPRLAAMQGVEVDEVTDNQSGVKPSMSRRNTVSHSGWA